MYAKVDMIHELTRVSKGQRAALPVAILVRWALDHCVTKEEPVQGDEVIFLERLYRLPDTRGAIR